MAERPVRRHRARAAGLDEPRRLDRPAAGGLPRHRPDRLDAVRRPGRSGPQPVRHPVPPRGGPHADRARGAAQLRGRDRRRSAELDGREPRRDDRGRDPRAGRRRPRHLRAVRRRRLGGRGDAGASGHRRPADLHLRRPRADAQARVGAAARHLRARPRHEAGDGRRARAVPARLAGRRGSGGEAPDHRRRVHPRLRGGGDEAGPDRLPDPGHALPGRHRVEDLGDQDVAEDQDPPQRRRACRPDLRFRLIEPLRYLFKDEVRRGRASSSACRRRWSSASRSPGRGSRSGSSAR